MNARDCQGANAWVADMVGMLAVMREAAGREPYPDLATRRDRLQAAIAMILRNEQRIVDALEADFGGRPHALSLMAEVVAPVNSLRHAHKHVAHWMRPEKRPSMFPFGLIGGRGWVHHQPLGVIGIVVPWNVPMGIGFTGLAGALAAGNRVMMKPSELAPNAAELMADMVAQTFDASEVAVVTGGIDVARQFSELPFDHLLYTGGPGVARSVMAAAARNLVPVTLELGGKSPAIVAPGADLAYAAGKVVTGKFGNAGQVCMGVDFAMVQRAALPDFVRQLREAMQRQFPDALSNPDFTNVHLARQRERLLRWLAEAEQGGARLEMLGGATRSALTAEGKFPPVLVVQPPPACALSREEIFGPVLPVFAYDSLDDAIAQVNALSRPLALYFIGGSSADKRRILERTHSGGVTFDDVMLHPMMQDLPFGGVGESGMGRYLGRDGFKAFSNQRGVYQRPWVDVSRFWAPPYTPQLLRRLRKMAGRVNTESL